MNNQRFSKLCVLGWVLSLLAITDQANGTEIVSVAPLTERIILVHFDDGFVRHHQLGEPNNNEFVVAEELDVVAASNPNSYRVFSANDANFDQPTTPSSINRKTKPTEFAFICQSFNGDCSNEDPDHADEHFLYLRLPQAMVDGKSYTVAFPGLTDLADQTFTYNYRQHRSEAVHVNQLGYVPNAGEKFGYVYHWLGDGGGLDFTELQNARFDLIDTATQGIAFSGTIAFRKPADNQEFSWIYQAEPFGNLVGVEVYECDFSAFTTPGNYRLAVAGVGASFPFAINDDVYFEPMHAVLNGLYQHRSGIATIAPFTDQPRPAPHNPALTPGFEGKLVYTTFRYPDFTTEDSDEQDRPAIEQGIVGPLDTAGWYQDAGDWDSYFSHLKVPQQLLWLYEMGATKFGDGQLLLPERDNQIPDLIDEATWLPRFHYRLRQELIAKGYGTGGVGGGRIFGDLWGDDVREDGTTQGSWQDNQRQWVCTGEDAFMTFKYAGIAGQIAYLMQSRGIVDPDGIVWSVEAVEAYQWATENMRPTDTNLFDLPMLHIRIAAAANLYRLTGNQTYQEDYLTLVDEIPDDVQYSNDLLFGLLAYTQTEGHQPTDAQAIANARARLKAEADFILLYFRDTRACRWGGNFWFPFLGGQSTTPYIEAGIIGHYLLRDSDPATAASYLEAIYSTADYFLGNNPLNMCWITGVGDRSPKSLLTLDAWYLGNGNPRRGVVPYGPWTTKNAFDNNGPFSHLWPFNYTYPESADQWPPHERWFEQRQAPFTNEYTVHQTMSSSIFTYGYLFSVTADEVATAEPLLGDINRDGQVNFLDILPFINLLAGDGFQSEADCNQDRVVDFRDIAPFIDLLKAS